VSRFLRAGLISDRVDDIIEASSILLRVVSSEDGKSRDLALDIADIASDLKEFIARWDCEPLIYTGRGTTDEVIALLDSLLDKAERVRRRSLRGGTAKV